MSLASDISNIPQPDQFSGGNDKQRAHLNELVDAVADIIQAANNNPDDGLATGVVPNTTVWYAVDGIPTEFGAYLTTLTAP